MAGWGGVDRGGGADVVSDWDTEPGTTSVMGDGAGRGPSSKWTRELRRESSLGDRPAMHEARRGVFGVGGSADDMMADLLQARSSGSGLAVPRGIIAADERLTAVSRPIRNQPPSLVAATLLASFRDPYSAPPASLPSPTLSMSHSI